MNTTEQNGEKAGYKVILLLVVGLTAFSSAMKELNQIRELGLQVNRLIAEWSEKTAPAEVPPMVVKLGSCESKQSEPAVELPWLTHVAQEEMADIEEPEVAAPVAKPVRSNNKVEGVKVKRERRSDAVQFEVRILSDQDGEPEVPAVTEFSVPSFKFKSRKHGSVRINPRDREILKILNRSMNLRIAS